MSSFPSLEELQARPMVVAEIGNNHGGDLDLAKRMVLAALDSGTRFVKFQTYIPESFLSQDHPAYADFVKEALSFDDFRELKALCDTKGAIFLSTPFDPESADFLCELNVPAIKISSGDLPYTALLRHIAGKQKTILLSTGASTLEDIDQAVKTIRESSRADLIILHCTSAYPCPDEEVNLAVIPELAKRYGAPVGLSDHTLGIDMAFAAVALGARVIEKHFTIDQSLPGGDNSMSIKPEEMKRLVEASERICKGLGGSEKRRTYHEQARLGGLRRKLFSRRDLGMGERVCLSDLILLRADKGIVVDDLERYEGRRIISNVKAGSLLQHEDFEIEQHPEKGD
jgi:N,N'-diacetyllegionaminate synthase